MCILSSSHRLELLLGALVNKCRQTLGSGGIIALTSTTRHCVSWRNVCGKMQIVCGRANTCIPYLLVHHTHSKPFFFFFFLSTALSCSLSLGSLPCVFEPWLWNKHRSVHPKTHHLPTLRHDFSVVKSPHVGSGAGGSGAGGSGAGGSVKANCVQHN